VSEWTSQVRFSDFTFWIDLALHQFDSLSGARSKSKIWKGYRKLEKKYGIKYYFLAPFTYLPALEIFFAHVLLQDISTMMKALYYNHYEYVLFPYMFVRDSESCLLVWDTTNVFFEELEGKSN